MDVRRGRPEPLSHAEHADRVRNIRDQLGWARDQRLTTDQRHLVDRKRGIWSRDRRDAHDAIVGYLYGAAAEVPCERKAIMAGGLGGAGKSTVLDERAGIDRSRYLTINPDGIVAGSRRSAVGPFPPAYGSQLADVMDAVLGQVGCVPRDHAIVGVVMDDRETVMRCGGGNNEVHR